MKNFLAIVMLVSACSFAYASILPSRLASATPEQKKQYCATYASYRDGPMFRDWDQKRNKYKIYQEILTSLEMGRAELKAKVNIADYLVLGGIIAHMTKTTADLITGLGGVNGIKSGVLDYVEAHRFYTDMQLEHDTSKLTLIAAETLTMKTIGDYNLLFRISSAAYTLSKNVSDIREFIDNNGNLKGELKTLLDAVEIKMATYKNLHVASEKVFDSLERDKSILDAFCGALVATAKKEALEKAKKSGSYCIQATNEAKALLNQGRSGEAGGIAKRVEGQCPQIYTDLAGGLQGGSELTRTMEAVNSGQLSSRTESSNTDNSANLELFGELLKLGVQSNSSKHLPSSMPSQQAEKGRRSGSCDIDNPRPAPSIAGAGMCDTYRISYRYYKDTLEYLERHCAGDSRAEQLKPKLKTMMSQAETGIRGICTK